MSLANWWTPIQTFEDLVKITKNESFYWLSNYKIKDLDTKKDLWANIAYFANKNWIDTEKTVSHFVREIYRILSKSNHREDVFILETMRNLINKENSSRDFLTWFLRKEKMTKEISQSIKNHERWIEWHFSILMLDIDNFKKINDNYWHIIWDQVIKWIWKILKDLRSTDIIARWWWEEFLVLLKWTNQKSAISVWEHIRKKIEKNLINYMILENENIHDCNNWTCNEKNKICINSITCSIWTYTMDNDEKDNNVTSIISKADEAMYASKNNWKNMVTSYETLEKITSN